jgi:hypothetical protein
MLLFRSEERVADWCREHQIPERPIISLPQLWQLAQEWYGSRLTAEARRPAPTEMVEIFSRIGLTGPFWDPRADSFS